MSMQMKKLPVGVSDFKEMITAGYYYVDKTLFIKDIIDKGDKVLLIPRPRRFGKTLNLSMVKYFYDCCPQTASPGDNRGTPPPKKETGSANSYKTLFESLAISKAGKEYLDKTGKHPVIYLTFKDVKVLDWGNCLDMIKKLIQKEYLRHDYLLDGKKLKQAEQEYFKRVVDLKGSQSDYESGLESLLIFLNRHYGQRVVVLVDEYDAPVHAGFTYGYYDKIVNLMRNFLGGGLKDTDQYLEKGIITGIMRIAKESIFSGLNNLGVYTLLSKEFDDKFGFTEEEVTVLLDDFGVFDRYDQVREWYDGYRFGQQVIYNPWSIVNFLGSEDNELKPYWLNTSDNAIVESLLSKGGQELKKEMEQLIRGETVEKAVEENIVLKDIAGDEDLLWSFLLMGGYLKQTGKKRDEAAGKVYYTLSIPNQEVRTTYTRIVGRYFSARIENEKLEGMLKALLEGEIGIFEEIFSNYVTAAMSFFDTAADPEKVYHAFVMGLLLWLSADYQVKSNRESGYGRYDIMIIPKDISKLGFIVEFKKVRKNETVESATEAALAQIEAKKYETELIERGIDNIKKLAIVFKGKEVTVKEG